MWSLSVESFDLDQPPALGLPRTSLDYGQVFFTYGARLAIRRFPAEKDFNSKRSDLKSSYDCCVSKNVYAPSRSATFFSIGTPPDHRRNVTPYYSALPSLYLEWWQIIIFAVFFGVLSLYSVLLVPIGNRRNKCYFSGSSPTRLLGCSHEKSFSDGSKIVQNKVLVCFIQRWW